VAEELAEPRERAVRWIRRNVDRLQATLRVETPDELWIAREPLGRGDVLEVMLLPQAAGVAERADAALGADPRAGENEDARSLPDRDGRKLRARSDARQGNHTSNRVPPGRVAQAAVAARQRLLRAGRSRARYGSDDRARPAPR